MEQYINKAALLAEIERKIKSLNNDRDFNYLQIKELEALLSFLDTVEMEEVDLDNYDDIKNAFKAGFELGRKAQKGE